MKAKKFKFCHLHAPNTMLNVILKSKNFISAIAFFKINSKISAKYYVAAVQSFTIFPINGYLIINRFQNNIFSMYK